MWSDGGPNCSSVSIWPSPVQNSQTPDTPQTHEKDTHLDLEGWGLSVTWLYHGRS